jgi:SNF2 family DNA or RNA helicase
MVLAPVGAGKTAMTLTAIQHALATHAAKRFLVLAPKRVVTDVWPVEAPKWAPKLTLAVACGSPEARLAALASKAQVVVTNYDNVQWLQSRR